jgi:hypothetical protein
VQGAFGEFVFDPQLNADGTDVYVVAVQDRSRLVEVSVANGKGPPPATGGPRAAVHVACRAGDAPHLLVLSDGSADWIDVRTGRRFPPSYPKEFPYSVVCRPRRSNRM